MANEPLAISNVSVIVNFFIGLNSLWYLRFLIADFRLEDNSQPMIDNPNHANHNSSSFVNLKSSIKTPLPLNFRNNPG